MLILPPGHAESLRASGRFSVRERRLVAGVVGVVVVLAVGLLISLASSGRTSGGGCIRTTIAGVVGAQAIDECGVAARNTCATVTRPGAYSAIAQAAIADACRRAGLAVGP